MLRGLATRPSSLLSARWLAAAAPNAPQDRPLFDKILIANRGEIACRVMNTARRLRIKTVAVFSEADRNSRHVSMADEAVCIGPAASAESYLRADKILEVAKFTGAQAVHPGYGFLSENASFSDACLKSGIEFIGPPAAAIRDMGSKSESKKIMINAQVPVVPGYHGDNQTVEFLKSEADKIGYPVLIKAVAGGGGKGMRIVERPEDFADMLQSSRRESLKSFGDDKVLVEKYLGRPRHVEVQVFADKHGNAVHLFERDCSVQRRHQKILEEAPAPGLSEEIRQDLGRQAVNAALAVKYVGAGTVEFIMDADTGKFFFMEMNTRLQVEHPITEMITRTDLVEWQLRVAAGNRLPLLQPEIKRSGHAFEARIYAENPYNNFLPDTGHLSYLSSPAVTDPTRIRVETGVRQGDDVSVFYDPMIAKLVVWDEDRNSALRSLQYALDDYKVVGPANNIQFLKDLAGHPAFVQGDVETGFINKHRKDLLPEHVKPASVNSLVQAAVAIALEERKASADGAAASKDPFSPSRVTNGWRANLALTRDIHFKDGETARTVTLTYNHDGSFDAKIQTGKAIENIPGVTGELVGNGDIRVEINGKRINGTVVRQGDHLHVFAPNDRAVLEVPPPTFLSASGAAAEGSVLSPMPCKITTVLVKEGQAVTKDQPLLILEAMKMEHVIKAPYAGVIESLPYKEGELVAEKKQLVKFVQEAKKKSE